VIDLVSAQQAVPASEAARVLRTAGVESESPLPFAALHRLLRPVVDFDRLPAPQAGALRVAFGLEDAPSAEPFLVGMATLSVLTDAAAEGGPVVCVVDDAQWLDSASADALLFAARQLDADPVVMVFAARYPVGDADAGAFRPQGLPMLELGGLDRGAARQLLGQRSGELPGEVADRLVRDTGGNQLALLELRHSTDSLGVRSHRTHRRLPAPVKNTAADIVPFAVAFDSSHRLIVANAGNSSVSTYRINADGTLRTLTRAVEDSQAALCWLVGTGNTFYGANAGSSTISAFAVDTDGTATLTGTSDGVVAHTGGGSGGTIDLAITHDGRLLYAENAFTGTVEGYAIQPDHTLTLVSIATGLPQFNGHGMEGLVAL
jgi:hypothetical protein